MKEIYVHNKRYTNLEVVGNGSCSEHVCSALGEDGLSVVLKVFPKSKRALSDIYLQSSSKNHYGRMRDVSELVFNEISNMNKTYPFLLKFINLNMLHHLTFERCIQRKCCFDKNKSNNRFTEDLRNSSCMGQGIVPGLEGLEEKHNLGKVLSKSFIEAYHENNTIKEK